MTTEKVTHWYKEPWMILIAGVPIMSIILGITMVTVAYKNKDTLVSDTYYKDGVNYTEDQHHDEEARRMKIRASLVFSEKEILLSMTSLLKETPINLELRLIHPTLEDQDESVFLERLPDGRYVGANPLTEFPQKRHIWLLSQTQEWRVRDTQVIDADKPVSIHAK